MARILVADDQPDLRMILSSRLRAAGHDVLEARDGVEALELASAQAIDLAILDVMMPELNGFQVCRRLREGPGGDAVPIVLLTARDSEADRFWGGEVGADLYLTKPIDPATVVAEVEALLRGR